MTNPITLKKLHELGLTANEAKSYLSLLQKDTLTVQEVSKIAGIPRTNAYESLERLLAKGFCVSRPGRSRRYSASDPALLQEKGVADLEGTFEIELNKLYSKQDEILEKKRAGRENLANLIKELTPLYKGSRNNESPLDYIEIIKEPSQVATRFARLVEGAKREVLVFTKPPYAAGLGSKELDGQVSGEITSLKRGVIHKSIYEIPSDPVERRLIYQEADEMVKVGEKARALGELPMKLAIFDEKTVIFTMEDPLLKKPSVTTLIIEHQSLAKTLKTLFNALWEKAADYHVLNTKGGGIS